MMRKYHKGAGDAEDVSAVAVAAGASAVAVALDVLRVYFLFFRLENSIVPQLVDSASRLPGSQGFFQINRKEDKLLQIRYQ